MNTRDLIPAVDEPAHEPGAEHMPALLPTGAVVAPGLEQIWRLFPDSHPRAASLAQAPHPQLTPEAARLLADEAYLARVHDLVRRDEQITAARALLSSAHALRVPAPESVHRPSAQPVPAHAWKYSVIVLSTGGGIALAGVGLGAAAPGLAVLDDLLAAAGQAVLGVAVLILVIGALLGAARGKQATGGTVVQIRKAVFKRNRFHG
ncbi:hypothetical protein ACH41H_24625 [Streptomyces sp. NPDC020800]|uniref:hypothetical protein n=1 Tax=Streptomyces sp. NPDC020800 TaxID=3365092 RepID=UPI00379A7AFE